MAPEIVTICGVFLVPEKEKNMSEIRFSSKEHEKFMISLRELTVVEYYLDILLFGDRADNSCMLRPDLERSL